MLEMKTTRDIALQRRGRLCLCLLLILTGLLGMGMREQAENSQMIRLHIFANSDIPHDQQVKLIVRDAVLERVEEILEEQKRDSRLQTEQLLKSRLTEISAIASGISEGYGYTARTEYGSFCFSERVWEGKRQAPGEYSALRITIGEGRGHNWFCVLYPQQLQRTQGRLKKIGGSGKIKIRLGSRLGERFAKTR